MEDKPREDRRFILLKAGSQPNLDENGEIVNAGVMGEITIDNVYLKVYAKYPSGSVGLEHLQKTDCIRNVKFSLSGESGLYDLWRVE